MNGDDIKFLKELQHEMLTQDTIGQASPRFWVVMQEVRRYGVDEEFSYYDGCEVTYNGESIAETLEDLIDYIKITDLIEDSSLEDEICNYDNLEELVDKLNDIGHREFNIVKYETEHKIVENTMFLTLRECEEHIRANHYHYTNPYPYAMTAWRSPQVARLYDILENVDWDKIKK